MEPRSDSTTGITSNRALDQAIDLLGAVLRTEAQDAAGRRAQLLRGRLAGCGESVLRARVLDAATSAPA